VIGTYSSIAVAAPMLVAYQDWRKSRGKDLEPAGQARQGVKGLIFRPGFSAVCVFV